MAKSTQQILDFLSDAGDTAVVVCGTRNNDFYDTLATIGAYENGLRNLQLPNSDGAKRIVLILTRQDSTASTIPTPQTAQRL